MLTAFFKTLKGNIMSDKQMNKIKKETAAKFKAATDDLVATLTSNEMLDRMRKFKNLPADERLAEAAKLLSVEGLEEMGVSLPEGMRLTSRYFESDLGAFEFQDVGDGKLGARQRLEKLDPDFMKELKFKHPEIIDRIDVLNPEIFEGVGVPGGTNLAACGGAGGSIGGTGGCACGGASTLF